MSVDQSQQVAQAYSWLRAMSGGKLSQSQVVAGDQDILIAAGAQQAVPDACRPDDDGVRQIRRKAADLIGPVIDKGSRTDDKRAPAVLPRCQHGDDLNRLAKAHLICQQP